MRSPLRSTAAAVAAAAIGIGVAALAVPVAHAEELAPDLVVSTLPTASPEPGESYDHAVTVTNKGTAPAAHVTFRIRLTRGLDFPGTAEGCTYSTLADHVRQALCELDTVVQPGASITTPVRFKALPQALMEAVEYGTGRTGETPGEGFGDSYRRLALTADSTADLAAEGDLVEGAPGSRVTVTATLRNNGPGWIRDEESDDQPALMVRIPRGTVAEEVPEDCRPFGTDGPTGPSEPGHARYVCLPADHTIDVDQSLDYSFVLEIGKTARDTKGRVTAGSVYGIHPAFDENPADDTAYLAVDVTGGEDPGTSTGGGTTTGGGTGGDGDPHGQSTGGSGTTGTTGTTGATGTTGTSGTTGTTGTSGGTSGTTGTSGSAATGSTTSGSGTATGGTLASTGSDGMPLLAAGAVGAVALGGLVLVVVRRRSTGK
ncbi:LPXTG cell wall anchor domain-containing protein [Streptomyces sp. NRRL S-1022]|uniref:LPXTG cell wall anchor domain-containing protein n=1 Tax=Streptomyces sp. NRRL S-1022 TaxID=1463880 RepID=UPI00056B8963|nr:LPXTG cell wall anchor domain-containing protein [Streptomyces sp. NRRL S-1022]